MNDVPTKTVAPIVRPEGEKERERKRERERERESFKEHDGWMPPPPPPPPPNQGVPPSWPPEDFSTQPEYALRELTQVPHALALRKGTVLGPG